MAKKQVPAERTRSKKNSKTHNLSKSKNTSRNSTTISAKNKSKNKIRKTANDDASSEETEVPAVPSSSTESQNDEVVESSEAAEEDEVSERSQSDEDEKEEKKKPKSIKKKGKSKDVKNKGKRRSRKAAEEEEEEEKRENALYRFPMNRVSRIIKSENSDLRISQEAVFLINRASEKFLQLFCREAYACAFLDRKNYTAYNHLSSVVSKRKRFDFLSDFIPEKLKAEDALAQTAEAEK
ncbi:hypothetical protein Salat_0451400 [Sesamum alatum]|uniref:Transcription factor CBF/NF-Y/archaeal histone domain-containing protein n=1 Tax=Sesamum alatum TaxID=300844 RepID=A0AAE1Z2Q6_9LAMI|nr:hypothetical protein Salat_0451400 [Sesamum alatum]